MASQGNTVVVRAISEALAVGFLSKDVSLVRLVPLVSAMSASGSGTAKLRTKDWKSGDNLWVVEVIAPFGGAEEMVKDLKAAVFPDREIKMLAVKDGKRDVRVA